MPLTGSVCFKAVLREQNRLQVPELLRWEYKLEPFDVLRVTVTVVDVLGVRESFLKMQKDGRIAVPKLTLELLKRDESSLEGCVLEVTLEPT